MRARQRPCPGWPQWAYRYLVGFIMIPLRDRPGRCVGHCPAPSAVEGARGGTQLLGEKKSAQTGATTKPGWRRARILTHLWRRAL